MSINPEDAARELDKAADALSDVSRHLNAVAEGNAALHLAETVRPSPLAVRVDGAEAEARRTAERFRNVPGTEAHVQSYAPVMLKALKMIGERKNCRKRVQPDGSLNQGPTCRSPVDSEYTPPTEYCYVCLATMAIDQAEGR